MYDLDRKALKWINSRCPVAEWNNILLGGKQGIEWQ
jgi:hypothetical protein